MIHHLLLWMGLTNASGGWYLFWSGFFGDVSIFIGLLAYLRHKNCHQKRCWRIGKHPHEHLVFCKKHHPKT